MGKKLIVSLCAAVVALGLSNANATLVDMLGQAGQYTVLSLDGTFLNLSNVTINGDTGVGPNGSASVMAPSTVNGTLFKDPTATVSGPGKVTGGIQTRDLTQAVADAVSASNAFNAMAATQMFTSISAATTITGNGGTNVINLSGGINLGGSNNLTLSGSANDKFIFNIQGALQMDGSAAVVLTGGVNAQNVVFNFVGANGGNLMTHVGNLVQGVVLAVDRNITFHGAFGEIIGGGSNLTLMSGAIVNGFTTVPEVTPGSVIFGFLGLIVAVSARRALSTRVRGLVSRK